MSKKRKLQRLQSEIPKNRLYGDLSVTFEANTPLESYASLLQGNNGYSVVAVNQSYTVPSQFKTNEAQHFPRPVDFTSLALPEGCQLLNRLTLELLECVDDKLDNLMHVLTGSSLCKQFDLIALAPVTFAQLLAIVNCKNAIFDMLCLEGMPLMHLRADAFRRLVQMKLFVNVDYSKVLVKHAELRCDFLEIVNNMTKMGKRYFKKFVISSGCTPAEIKEFPDIKRYADMMGFDQKMFALAVEENVKLCCSEAEIRRLECPACFVFPLTEEMRLSKWYNHETRKRIDQYILSQQIEDDTELVSPADGKVDKNETETLNRKIKKTKKRRLEEPDGDT